MQLCIELILPYCWSEEALRPTRLERMELGMCGRGFGNETAQTLAGVGPLPALRYGRLCSACVQGLNAVSVKAQSPASTALHRALRCARVCSKVVLWFIART